jgi:hypothetical protein
VVSHTICAHPLVGVHYCFSRVHHISWHEVHQHAATVVGLP